MSFINNNFKLDYLYKKEKNVISKNPELKIFEETNLIKENVVNNRSIIYSNKQFYRDKIDETVPNELIDVLLDDENNIINGSLLGKSSNNGVIKKYVKIKLSFLENSVIYDENNNIKVISYYHKLLENSSPYNYDYKGSYMYKIYKDNNEINFNEGDWFVNNEAGILTFYDNVLELEENSNIYISFYKYNSVIGLEPIEFNRNRVVSIKTNLIVSNNLDVHDNLSVKKNLFIKKSLDINGDLNLNTINIEKRSSLPAIETKNRLICTDESLYFYHKNKWNNLIAEELKKYSLSQFIYSPLIFNINISNNSSIANNSSMSNNSSISNNLSVSNNLFKC